MLPQPVLRQTGRGVILFSPEVKAEVWGRLVVLICCLWCWQSAASAPRGLAWPQAGGRAVSIAGSRCAGTSRLGAAEGLQKSRVIFRMLDLRR